MKEELTMNLPSEGFVRLPVILQALGIKKSFFWEQVKEGRFPKPIKIGPRISVWRVEDIRRLIDDISNQKLTKSP
ncbi:MAG: AlpA family phage regulatory protein [Planctomycetaceae bacterium]|nr:AlpA family phage regulatory protein [Planctomycetaceae bacterium]